MTTVRWFGRLLAIAVTFMPLPALAQHEKGDVSLSGFGSLSLQSDATGLVGAQLGLFVSRNMELGGSAQVFIATTTTPTFNSRGFQTGSTTSTDVSGTVGGYLRKYWGADRTRPYLGLNADIPITSGSSGVFGRGSLGVRFYKSRNASFYLEGQYGAAFVSGETTFDKGPTVVFGFAVVF